MNKKLIKQCLRTSMENQFNSIKGYEFENKKEEMKMKNNLKKVMIPFSLVAALSFSLVFGVSTFINNKVETMVALDVNPAIEMKLNKNEKVVGVEAKNEDAKEIIGDMKLKNVDADVAVNALVGSMLKNGYLHANSKDNNILLTVANSDTTKSKQIKEKLTKTIKDTLNTNNSKAEILLQEEQITDEDFQDAKEYDITVGRAKFINKLIEKSPELSQDELSKMTITELVEYLEDKNVDYDDIIEKDDDIMDDLEDQEEDRQDLIKEEQEKIEEQKEEEAERVKEEQEKIEEQKEEEAERVKEQQEKIEEQKEKEAERVKEEQEKIEEQKEEEAERAKEQQEQAEESKETNQ